MQSSEFFWIFVRFSHSKEPILAGLWSSQAGNLTAPPRLIEWQSFGAVYSVKTRSPLVQLMRIEGLSFIIVERLQYGTDSNSPNGGSMSTSRGLRGSAAKEPTTMCGRFTASFEFRET
jgi:hypothetical protein